jgi:hypothetical protein
MQTPPTPVSAKPTPPDPAPEHPDAAQIHVLQMFSKFESLFQYVEANPGRGFPKSQTDLVAAVEGPHVQVTAQTLSKAKNDQCRLSVATHRAMLAKFGIAWPCPEYYEDTDDALRRDKHAINFERLLFPHRHVVRLAPIVSNKGDFIDPDLFVFKLDNRSIGREYQGVIVAKPASRILEGEEGRWTGQKLGSYGLTSFTVTLNVEDGMELRTLKSGEDEAGGAPMVSIRDMSTNLQHRWKVERHSGAQSQPLNENIELTRIMISEMPASTKLTISAYGPGPQLFLTLPHSVLKKSNLDERALERKIKQVLLNKMKLRFGDQSPASDENIALGEIYFRSVSNKP